ncbi:3-phytase B precursor [Lineolata rhizophorae]|uniref:3-phytase B n=1 Tax=Lineolata rhizophorae TaxID=578093 RepID=A0A6A6P2I5_9PEZI|nr:3-phytase B precursor [Lineolata rhizophorae]
MALLTRTTASAAVCLVISLLLVLLRKPAVLSLPAYLSPWNSCPTPNGREGLSQFYLQVPYAASWKSWWDPHGAHHNDQSWLSGRRGQGGGVISHDWNILYHLGGNGPWVEKVDGTVDGGIAVPHRCTVDQVHMLSRHAERYPTLKAAFRLQYLVNAIEEAKENNATFHDDLEFLNKWNYFLSDPPSQIEQLTSTGPFAGSLGAFSTGVKLRTRYSNLLSNWTPPSGKTNFWAGDSPRVIDTAKHFAAGFFGLKWNDTAQLHIIPETPDRGGDTLTPGKSCSAYLRDPEHSHMRGMTMMSRFRSTYLPSIQERLRAQDPTFAANLDEGAVFSMQELCGFETTVRGGSSWCGVFTRDEWRAFEYARDLVHYYRSGPGNRFGAVMGWVWLNATASLLAQGPGVAGPLFLSFVHDGDMVMLLAALDVFRDEEHLPVTHEDTERKWRTSQVTPMGGRIILERLSCEADALEDQRNGEMEVFVRLNINDGIVALPGCESGPGKSCPLDQFLNMVASRGKEVGSFAEMCSLSQDAPDRITFLHQ